MNNSAETQEGVRMLYIDGSRLYSSSDRQQVLQHERTGAGAVGVMRGLSTRYPELQLNDIVIHELSHSRVKTVTEGQSPCVAGYIDRERLH